MAVGRRAASRAALTVACGVACAACGPGTETLAGPTMGTTYAVVVDARLSAGERARLEDVVRRTLVRVETVASTYDTASELSRFNRLASTEPVPIGAELRSMLATAARVHARSDGAFDPTVLPVVRAFGFGPADEGPARGAPNGADAAPGAVEAAGPALGVRVGFALLSLDTVAGTLAKVRPEVEVDLSAVAKGYAVDRLTAELSGLGYAHALVEVGGEVRAGGRRADGTPWRVGVEAPDPAGSTRLGVLGVEEGAVATSGDHRAFHERDGRTVSHLVDPRSGLPLPYSGVAVTVVASSAAEADAWATALVVLGPEDGPAVAAREGVAALFTTRGGDGFVTRETAAFSARARWLEAPRR